MVVSEGWTGRLWGGLMFLQKPRGTVTMRTASRLAEGAPALVGVLYHEVGNLLVGIQSASWFLMRDARNPEEGRERYEAVQEACLRADSLLRRTMEQLGTRDPRGKSPRRVRVDLFRQVQEEVHLQLSTARDRGRSSVRLHLEPAWVVGEPDELRLVVGNLLENALKFSPADAKVDIRLRSRGNRVLLEVMDRGPGVEPSLQRQIFRAFRRGTTPVQGKGLGLWIVKRAVRAHGGKVGVRPRKGGGSCFRVSLPACPVNALEEPLSA